MFIKKKCTCQKLTTYLTKQFVGRILNYLPSTIVRPSKSYVDLLKTRCQQREYILGPHTYEHLYGNQYIYW